MTKGKSSGFNVSYDPKFLFSCDFISIPCSEGAQAFGLRVSTFQTFLCRLFLFLFNFLRLSDSKWRMAWLGTGYWLWEIPLVGSGSLRICLHCSTGSLPFVGSSLSSLSITASEMGLDSLYEHC